MTVALAPPACKSGEYIQEEGWFQLIVKSSPYAMIVVDGARKVVLANRGAETLFGYESKEMASLDLEALIPVRYRENHAGSVSSFLRWPHSRTMAAAGHLVGRRKDGSEAPVEIGLNPIEAGGKNFILASIVDVTERRYHEQALRLAVETAPNAMLVIDERAQIAFLNKGSEALFGYTRDELLGQPIQILVPDRFRGIPPEFIGKYLLNPKPRPFAVGRDLFGRRKDGAEVPIEVGLNSLETPKGRFTLASIVDITERWRYEDELRRSKEEAIKDKKRAEDRALLLRRLWDEIAALAFRCGLPGIGETPALFQEACESALNIEASLAAALTPFETAFRGYVNANQKLAEQIASSPPQKP